MTTEAVKYGIIGAMDIEVELLHQAMEASLPRVTRVAGMEFWEGSINGSACVAVQCGVGMVNAAACAQVLIDRFGANRIINTGAGGSLDARIDIGDFVVAQDAVNWAMDVCNLGYEPGQTPGMQIAFPTDRELGERIAQAAESLAGVGVHRGRVASADRFVRDSEEKKFIAETFGALCCEMEGAAIAQTCFLNGVPCAVVRAISDKADGSDALDYPVFEKQAAHNSAAVICKLLELG